MAIGTKKRLVHAAAIILVMSPVTAVTQSAPMMETVPVSYTGIAMDWFADSIRIIQPDGSLTEYRGPLPTDFAVRPGDTINFSFNVSKPAGMDFGGSSYDGQVAVDGQYKISVNQQLEGGSGSWNVLGGGAGSEGGEVPGQQSGPLSASYQVGFNSETGETEVLSGSLPQPAAQAVVTEFVQAAPPPVAEQGTPEPAPTVFAEPVPASQPVTLAATTPASEPQPVGGATATALPFVVETPPPSVAQAPQVAPTKSAVPVPAPGALLLFAMAAAMLPLRRKFARA
ncbi:MAG: hypothetical protein R3D89_09085 [Sphingomonadaceae bacterium]